MPQLSLTTLQSGPTSPMGDDVAEAACPLERQKGDNWCWAAVASGIAAQHQVGISQCKVAEIVFGAGRSCSAAGQPLPDADREPQNLDSVLSQMGRRETFKDRALRPDELLQEMREGSAVACLIKWRTGGRHYVVVDAISVDSAGRATVRVQDPHGHQSALAYEDFLTRYRNEGEWIQSCLTQ